MQTRYRAAATALLLTATAGLAATGGAAQASGTHHTGDRAANKLVVTVKYRSGQLTLSDTKFRPGNTIFKLAPHGKNPHTFQVARLKSGYTLAQANQDFGAAFNDGDVHAVRRIDRNVVFYGGNTMSPKGGDPTFWGVKINKPGLYYLFNLDTNALTTFKAKGTTQKRRLPSTDGWLNMVTTSNGGNAFRIGKHNANSGWMSTTNNAKEPHFADLAHVKKSTTPQDVSNYFSDPSAPPVPPFAAKDGAQASTGVISPGKSFVWTYSLPKGKYLTMCFWPSKADGMPHALMGMWKLTNLG